MIINVFVWMDYMMMAILSNVNHAHLNVQHVLTMIIIALVAIRQNIESMNQQNNINAPVKKDILIQEIHILVLHVIRPVKHV